MEMEMENIGGKAKHLKSSSDMETTVEDGTDVLVPAEENEVGAVNSELVEMEFCQILKKIDNFTQMVSMLLETGKSVLKELTYEFEYRIIYIHKEQIEKWPEEIKELRLLDTANEEIDALLHNAKYLLPNIHGGC